MSDFGKMNRRDEIKNKIKELTAELNAIDAYFENKKKVSEAVGGKKMGKYKGLLGLYNKTVYNPRAFCELKCCYLSDGDTLQKRCQAKGSQVGHPCRHFRELSGLERLKGIKGQQVKFFDLDCK